MNRSENMGIIKKLNCLFVTFLLFFGVSTAVYAETLFLPTDLKTIEEAAFAGDTSLDQIVVPEGTLTIGSRAFANSSVKAIALPQSLTTIEEDAFLGSRPAVSAVKGSYACNWAKDHGLLPTLAFTDDFAYDWTVERAAFVDNPEIGLSHNSWVRNYMIKNYENLADKISGEPEWDVSFIGESQGASITYTIGSWAGSGARAIDVKILDEPKTDCVLHYKVSCTWGGETIIALGTLQYRKTALPAGIEAPDTYYLRVGEPYLFHAAFLPLGFSFGTDVNTGVTTDMKCSKHNVRENGEGVCEFTPLESGIFTVELGKNSSNIVMSKKVRLYVSDDIVPGWQVTEGSLSDKASQTLANYSGLTAKQKIVEGIPLYEVFQDDGTEKPLVILFHPGGGSKEQTFQTACNYARMGVYAVAIDSAGCGESQIGPIDAVESWSVTVKQVDTLIEYYGWNPQADAQRFGLFGASMGANITYAYVVHGSYKPTVIVAHSGTPNFADDLADRPLYDAFDHGTHCANVMTKAEIRQFAKSYSPINSPEAFLDVVVCAGNGLADEVERPDGCKALEQYLTQHGGTKHFFSFYEGLGHTDSLPFDINKPIQDYLL